MTLALAAYNAGMANVDCSVAGTRGRASRCASRGVRRDARLRRRASSTRDSVYRRLYPGELGLAGSSK